MRQGRAAEYLGAELESLVLTGNLPSHRWPDGGGWEHEDPQYDDSEQGQGDPGTSQNWRIEALGCRFSVNYRARGWNRIKEATEFFARARIVWGGSELDSLIYEYMQGHSVLEICHAAGLEGQTAIRNEAMAWLRYAAARCEMFRSPRTGRILAVGDRSAGIYSRGDKVWQDHFADIGMNRASAPSEPILSARADLVREAFTPMRNGYQTPVDALRSSGHQTWATVRVIEWVNGKVVFRTGSRWHGATQPVCIAWEESGVTRYAPDNRGYKGDGDRTHRWSGSPTVTENPTDLRYDSAVYPSMIFALPPKEMRLLDVEIGGPLGVKDLLTTKPPVDPPKPGTQPKPPKKENKWTGWL